MFKRINSDINAEINKAQQAQFNQDKINQEMADYFLSIDKKINQIIIYEQYNQHSNNNNDNNVIIDKTDNKNNWFSRLVNSIKLLFIKNHNYSVNHSNNNTEENKDEGIYEDVAISNKLNSCNDSEANLNKEALYKEIEDEQIKFKEKIVLYKQYELQLIKQKENLINNATKLSSTLSLDLLDKDENLEDKNTLLITQSTLNNAIINIENSIIVTKQILEKIKSISTITASALKNHRIITLSTNNIEQNLQINKILFNELKSLSKVLTE
jgi:hypothetical protein